MADSGGGILTNCHTIVVAYRFSCDRAMATAMKLAAMVEEEEKPLRIEENTGFLYGPTRPSPAQIS